MKFSKCIVNSLICCWIEESLGALRSKLNFEKKKNKKFKKKCFKKNFKNTSKMPSTRNVKKTVFIGNDRPGSREVSGWIESADFENKQLFVKKWGPQQFVAWNFSFCRSLLRKNIISPIFYVYIKAEKIALSFLGLGVCGIRNDQSDFDDEEFCLFFHDKEDNLRWIKFDWFHGTQGEEIEFDYNSNYGRVGESIKYQTIITNWYAKLENPEFIVKLDNTLQVFYNDENFITQELHNDESHKFFEFCDMESYLDYYEGPSDSESDEDESDDDLDMTNSNCVGG